ncbi:Sec-independent protein translocase TatD [Shewanella psychrophila]|uniref:Sec-independent protein translocase TatD n=1 Tax=Shewanella psychrophila TaxID=225848 RepID=A0A1S6HRQ0_9GAMM|nr:TatD family hydrolase [Shewanella psychrophila]AQS38203.1 Sec-independent protein translocase TatD [Shewanella psychrophila]
MSKYIDIAVNLIGSALEKNIDDVIQDAAAQGVSPLIVIGSELHESEQAITCCQQYPKQLYCTAGVHPHHASEWQAKSSEQLKRLTAQPQVVAVGECGLDYNRDFSPRPMQRKAFEAQLALAAELKMPVLMHERDAHEDFLAILKEYRSSLPGALLHCFTGNRQSMQAYLALDLHLGITGWVCDERRGQELAELVIEIPDNRILIETDSPYLLPRSMRPKPKSSKNKPQYLPYISAYIADLRGQSHEKFAQRVYENSVAFFGLNKRHAVEVELSEPHETS